MMDHLHQATAQTIEANDRSTETDDVQDGLTGQEIEGPHYVYGIVRCDVASSIGGRAIADPEAAVRVLPVGRFAAIVSACDIDEVDPTRRNLLAHTKILETAMQEFTVLPVRFGTILPDIDVLARVLGERDTELQAMHDDIHGHVELGLKINWQRDTVLQKVLATSSELQRLRERIQRKDPAKAYYDQIDFGRRLEDAMHEQRDSLADAALTRLEPLAARSQTLKPVDDQMVLNAAFLLPADAEAAFDAAIAELADTHDDLSLRYVGPVPPYNFVKLSIEWTA